VIFFQYEQSLNNFVFVFVFVFVHVLGQVREQELKRIQQEREERIQKVRNPLVPTPEDEEEMIKRLKKEKPKVIRVGYEIDTSVENLPLEEKLTRIRFVSSFSIDT
jgi:chorismate synthase